MNIKNWRTFRYFDLTNFLIMGILASIGLIFVFSATYTSEQPFSSFFIKQLSGIITGFFIYFLCLILDHRSCIRWGFIGYFITISLLIFTLMKGSVGMGAQRWISLIFFKLQPSELAKLFLPSFIVYYLYTHKNAPLFNFFNFIPIIGIALLSFILILKQPDLGTALIVLFSFLIMCWLAGITKKFFIYGFLILITTMPFSWRILKPYQKNRVTVFLGYGNTKKERYQIEQATIAIGSGGLTGKGLLHGTQNKLRFLPEGRTDFIFAVLSEELGLAGGLFVLFLYTLLFYRSFLIIQQINDWYMQLFATGTLMHIILSTVINIGMVLGFLPIVGIPLPLMSYGISNLWITFASFGLLQNIAMQRSKY
ncbi:MAG: FtsW/RodA/SpoVE family cell cycle protein [Candidatus Babeliales bacterium]|jgi:rod shape determining protein RodA